MPKTRTNRSAAKRLRANAGGKLLRGRANARHLLSGKSPKRKRHLRKDTLIDPADERRLKRMLGMA